MFGMLPLDSFVVLAIHHPYRYPNLAELHLRPVWLVFPHLGDLIVKGGILPRSCGELRIFSAGARNKGGEGGVLLHIVLEPGGRSIGAECEYTSHPLGMTHRQVEADLSMKDSNSVDRVAGVSARNRSRRWRQRLPQLGRFSGRERHRKHEQQENQQTAFSHHLLQPRQWARSVNTILR